MKCSRMRGKKGIEQPSEDASARCRANKQRGRAKGCCVLILDSMVILISLVRHAFLRFAMQPVKLLKRIR